MTGPEHYAKAETLLDEIAAGRFPDRELLLAAALAQAHATLALADMRDIMPRSGQSAVPLESKTRRG
jgi:hypothetical protein